MISEKTNDIIESYISTLKKLKLKPDQLDFLIELDEKDPSQGTDNYRAQTLKDLGYLMQIQGFSHKSNKHDFVYNDFLIDFFEFLQKTDLDLQNRIKMADISTLEDLILSYIDFYKDNLKTPDFDPGSIRFMDCSNKTKLGMDFFFDCEKLEQCRDDTNFSSHSNCCPNQSYCSALLFNILQRFSNIISEIEPPIPKIFTGNKQCGIRIYYKRRNNQNV